MPPSIPLTDSSFIEHGRIHPQNYLSVNMVFYPRTLTKFDTNFQPYGKWSAVEKRIEKPIILRNVIFSKKI